RFLAIPTGCMESSTVNTRSMISTDSSRLECWVGPRTTERRLSFATLVVGATGAQVDGTVSVRGGGSSSFPTRLVTPGVAARALQMRLLSSPDFLNADIGDLSRGPNFWTPARSGNSINDAYRQALNAVLDDFEAADPDGVLVAGDLVDGQWGTDKEATGNFGPVETQAQREKALARAAATYYPQWLERFERRGLEVFPAMSDHEYGDDGWAKAEKRALAPAFRKAFGRYLTRTRGGKPRFADRPNGPHEFTAYAGRPRPDVQIISIDTLDITEKRARVRVEKQQMAWLKRVLAKANRDGVKWIIVQGGVPILFPTRVRGSSGLHYEGGRKSELWKVFKTYGVDLYLTGEVHDVTATEADGITQITHGGAFQFGLTNYLLLDFYGDLIYLTLRDFDSRRGDYRDGNVWGLRPKGVPRRIDIAPEPFTIGTGVLTSDGDLLAQSGILTPWNGRCC
ncbi:MAG: metallophosphoesterase, partial [Nocardioides sp.]